MKGGHNRPDPDVVLAARALAPLIAACADRIEAERRLPAEVVAALAGAGLFRMLVPRYLGGAETDAATYARAIEEIAKVDGSTAWCLGQAAGSGAMSVRMEPPAAAAIWGDPAAVVAWGQQIGQALEVAGGYRLTGNWTFASGIHHATWVGGNAAVVRDAGTPVLDAAGTPQHRLLMFPARSVSITDVWQVSGLRGTGTDHYSVSDLFVPAAYAMPTIASAGETPHPAGALYAMPPVLYYAIGFASVALGIARGALDAFLELAQHKRPRLSTAALRQDAVVQFQVGQAEAELRAAHAFLHLSIGEAWAAASDAGDLTQHQRVLLRLASTHSAHVAARVTDTVYHAAGATAIFAANPFERRFRDVHAVTQQVQAAQAHFGSTGRYFLGLDAGSNAWR